MTPRLSAAFFLACRRWEVHPTRHVLAVDGLRQRLHVFRSFDPRGGRSPTDYQHLRELRASTSRFGLGQTRGSNRTPLGLHRVGEKIGAGWPVGTVFRARQVVGFVWAGLPDATIAHRILWLRGLEPGWNHGGEVDTHARHIYIHGLADEPTLGRPASHGCIHLAAQDLIPLFDRLPGGTLVWLTTSVPRGGVRHELRESGMGGLSMPEPP